MRAWELAAFADRYGDEEVEVEVLFPELGGFGVSDWAWTAGEDGHGRPRISVELYGTDFDYPDSMAALRRIADSLPPGWGLGR